VSRASRCTHSRRSSGSARSREHGTSARPAGEVARGREGSGRGGRAAARPRGDAGRARHRNDCRAPAPATPRPFAERHLRRQLASDRASGGAHTREKILAAAAERFVVIVSADKLVDELAPPIPLELLAFGIDSTLRALAPTTLRPIPRSPDGGLIADYQGPVGDPGELADRLSSTPGVIEHGLFPPGLVSEVLAAIGPTVEAVFP